MGERFRLMPSGAAALLGASRAEERRLAGRIAAGLWALGAVTALLLFVLPGVEILHPVALLGVAAVGAAWALIAFAWIPWERVPSSVFHVSTVAGYPITFVAMAATGGAGSPTRFYLFFVVLYVAYFFSPRQAAAYVAGCIALRGLPLFVDSRNALDAGLVAELVIVAPTYVVLATMIAAGRRILVTLSLTDPLTELPNRRALYDVLARWIGGRRNDELAVVMIDLDDFKRANTELGHAGGDRVLRAAADALRGVTRKDDLVARLGGDEFAVVARGVRADVAERLGRRIVDTLEQAGERLDLPPGVSLRASVGWSLCPRDGTTVEDVLRAADVALLAAKRHGKGRAFSAARRPVHLQPVSA